MIDFYKRMRLSLSLSLSQKPSDALNTPLVLSLICPRLASGLLLASACCAIATAQTTSNAPPSPSGWQSCQSMGADPAGQLKCFQDWAATQTAPANVAAPLPAMAAAAPIAAQSPSDVAPSRPVGCRDDTYSALSRFWELQRGSDCDTFGLRGYRPTTLAFVTADGVNTQPTSGMAGHSASTPTAYKRQELKIQLSVRTKVAKGMLKTGATDAEDLDSLWFGYSQQSYWQLFNGAISRPFRSTDHEPELIYIYPHQIPLPGGWSYRLSGLGLVHQSNGQSLPLSRSWNRVYLMGAAEKIISPTSSLNLQARLWQRLKESSSTDDNPGIENFIGRAELAGRWQFNPTDSVGLTLRHPLSSATGGSARLDWTLAPSSAQRYTSLRYHLQLFTGYGDSLIDYNRKRTVISLGLSLVDW